nr:ECF transporter S component [Lentilactobacillus raoultii]
MNSIKLKRLTLASIFLALCVVGANIKIMGSVAFDSAPAFLGAVMLGPLYGAFLGFFGHMVSAALAGFPLTLPIHLIIGFFMGICMAVFGWIRLKFGTSRWGTVIISDIVGYAINVPLEMLFLYPLMKAAILAFFVPLTIATILNIIVCEGVYAFLPRAIKSESYLRGH